MQALGSCLILHVLSLLSHASAYNSVPWPTSRGQTRMSMSEISQSNAIPVPGSNNAYFGPIPKEKQIFKCSLYMTPKSFSASEYFYIHLQGAIEEQKRGNLTQDDLDRATFEIARTMNYPDGTHSERNAMTLPLMSMPLSHSAAISIRDWKGAFAKHFSVDRDTTVVVDMLLPGIFVETGEYTFEVIAKVPDGRCLFAITITQYLEQEPW